MGRTHRLWQVTWQTPVCREAFVGKVPVSREGFACECQGHILDDVAAVIAINRILAGIAVDTDEAPYTDLQSRFFPHFTLNGFVEGFPNLDSSPWQRPGAIAPLMQEYSRV